MFEELPMELHQLRCFVVMAEELNFGRAARRLHTSPSPLYANIKQLEHLVGVRLFRRDKRTVALTDGGLFFLEKARNLIASIDDAVDCARLVADAETAAASRKPFA
jgi:DNA-binding transcriptional LysR family regulator